MNDLLSSPEFRLLPREGYPYSLDFLGMMLGIIAVALNLSVAVMAAANAALASHLSLQPEQKAPNIEAHLIFCVIVLFGTAVVSGSSLTLLSINIDPFFTLCWSCIPFRWLVFNSPRLGIICPHWLKRVYKTHLSVLSLILLKMAFIVSVAQRDVIIWVTIPGCHFTLNYHVLVDIRNNMPSSPSKRGYAFILCLYWTACSVTTLALNSQDLRHRTAFGVVSGLEAITLAFIGIGSSWERRIWERRRRFQMNLGEA